MVLILKLIEMINLTNTCNQFMNNKMIIKYDKNKMNKLIIIIISSILPIVNSSGLFELDIIKYENYNFNETISPIYSYQHLSLWNNLINWSSNNSNQPNHLNSNLIYNLCLKESKAYVLGKPCTFGEIQSSVKLPNQPVNLKELFTFRWTKSITLILTIMKLDEKTGVLKQIDKHVHFDSNLLPINNNNLTQLNDDQQLWTYKLSINSYSRLLFRFRITCSLNYYGEDCSRFCRERDDLFGHYSCNKDGKQICLNGWYGEQCDMPICSMNCSQSNGYCKKPNECLCKPGYRGLDCTECIPHQNCLNGFCELPNQCICKSNWGGLFCNIDLSYCSNHQPCLNGGLCVSLTESNQYKCICKPGFNGTNCEQIYDISNINECESSPCLNNGTCLNKINGYECLCDGTGFNGTNCDTNIDDCSMNPCFNQGECLDLVNDYKCLCKKGFKGKNCDKFDDYICDNLNNNDDIDDNDMKIYFKNILNKRFEDEYWPIQSDLITKFNNNTTILNNQEKCKSKWCTCTNNNINSTSSMIKSNRNRNLICICIKETEYIQLNNKQLNKLDLIINPTVNQLMLVSNQDLELQNYLLNQLKIKKQNLSNNLDNLKQNIDSEELNQFLNDNELINEILIDNNLDKGDDLIVSLTLNFNSTLNNNQIDSICSSMIAIYSLLCNQPHLDQLNFACKIKNRSPTKLRFLSLDNDERILKVGNIIGQTINNRLDYKLNYRLKSILKRTYQFKNLNNKNLTRWQQHCLIILNLSIIIWLIVIIIMIFILLSNENDQLKIRIAENRLLNLISLQLNRKLYRKTDTEINLNNRIIHNKLRDSKNLNLIDNINCMNNHLKKTKYENNYIINNQINLIKDNNSNNFNNFNNSNLNNQIDSNHLLIDNYKKEYKKETNFIIENQNDYKLIKNNDYQLKIKLTDNKEFIKSSDKIVNKVNDNINKIIKPVHL